jgi:hypothetical protein
MGGQVGRPAEDYGRGLGGAHLARESKWQNDRGYTKHEGHGLCSRHASHDQLSEGDRGPGGGIWTRDSVLAFRRLRPNLSRVRQVVGQFSNLQKPGSVKHGAAGRVS